MSNGKKKLLIVNNNLTTGGVQRSFVNLLHEIKDQFDVTVLVFSNSGEYRDCLPVRTRVLEGSGFLKLLGMSQVQIKSQGYLYYCARAALVLFAKVFGNRLPIRLLVRTHEKLSGFDAAVSFLHSAPEKYFYGGCNEFVLDRVNAKQKITFLHCDFLNYGGYTARSRQVYKCFDTIAAVSEGCRRSFIKAIPELAEKTYCVGNCHTYSEYIAKSGENPVEYLSDSLNIVTVARLSVEKGILRGVDVISRLVREGHRIKWHIIGNGAQRKEIENRISVTGSASFIFLYGNQENPYRYMKNADVFLLPSLHEAAPMVFAEAKCLGLPIITTNTTSAQEMVADGKDGFVCENSEQGIYETLKDVLGNPQKLQVCREHLAGQKYSNERAVGQFHTLVNGRS